jgi:hypothetical protein
MVSLFLAAPLHDDTHWVMSKGPFFYSSNCKLVKIGNRTRDKGKTPEV